VMITVKANDGFRLTLATRAPAASVPGESMGMMLMGSGIYWASDTNRLLQVSTNLNDWAGIPGTLGQSSYTVNPANATKGFFRVMGTL